MSNVSIVVNANEKNIVVSSVGIQGATGGNGVGGSTAEIKETLSASVTTWTLVAVPASPHLSKLFINGQKQTFGTDYVVNGAQVSWLGYALKTRFKIEIYYL